MLSILNPICSVHTRGFCSLSRIRLPAKREAAMTQLSQKAPPEVVPVVIGSYYNAYGIVRSFADAGVRSILVTGRKKCSIQYSKYLEKHVAMAEPKEDEAQFIADMLELGKSLRPRRGMFFPTRDEQLIAIAKNADALSAYYEIPFSGWDVCREIIEKASFHDHCEALGIPTVRERLVASLPEALHCLDILRLPLVVKGNSVESNVSQISPSGKMVFYDRDGYEAHMRRFFKDVPSEALLVQEYIEDSDRYLPTVNCFTDRDGNMRCVYIYEVIRKYPPKTGTSTAANIVDPEDPVYAEVIAYTQKLLSSFRFYGLSGTEFKYDPADGDYKIIETNIRSEFPNYLQTLAGQNMPYQLYRYHLGLEVTIPYFPVLKRAQCRVPFEDRFKNLYLNRLYYPDSVLSRRKWRDTKIEPHTLYGLTMKDIKPFLHVYFWSAFCAPHVLFRAWLHIPGDVRTIDYFRKKVPREGRKWKIFKDSPHPDSKF